MKTVLSFAILGESIQRSAERSSIHFDQAPTLAEVGDFIQFAISAREDQRVAKVVRRTFAYSPETVHIFYDLIVA